MGVKRFEDLKVWQTATEIGIKIYSLSLSIKEFGLKDQVLRSSISISSNIAEGFESGSNKNFIRYLSYSKASCGELRSQIYILHKIGLLNEERYNSFYNDLLRLSKQLNSFIKYLKNFDEKAQAQNM